MNGRTSSHSWIGLPPAPGAADNNYCSGAARSTRIEAVVAGLAAGGTPQPLVDDVLSVP